MSYYKVRGMHVDKNGKLQLTVADSSIRDGNGKLIWVHTTYAEGKTTHEALLSFFMDCLNGNLRIVNRKLPAYGIVEGAFDQITKCCPDIDSLQDHVYSTDYSRQANQIWSESYAVPAYQKENPDISVMQTRLVQLNNEAKIAYSQASRTLREQKIVLIRYAMHAETPKKGQETAVLLYASPLEPEKAYENNLLIGKESQYDNNGKYDNTDGSLYVVKDQSAVKTAIAEAKAFWKQQAS